MKCEKCGTITNQNGNFCPACGNKFENVSSFFNSQANNNVDLNGQVNYNLNQNSQINNNMDLNNQSNYNLNSNNQINSNMNLNSQPNNNGSSKLGAISIALGILSIVSILKWPLLGIIFAIIGIVLAAKYKKQTNNKTAGKALSIIGLILSILAFILKVLLIIGISVIVNLFDAIKGSGDVTVNESPSTPSVVPNTNPSTPTNVPSNNVSTLVCTFNGVLVDEKITLKFNDNNAINYTLESEVKKMEDYEPSQIEAMHMMNQMANYMMHDELKNEYGVTTTHTENEIDSKLYLDVDFTKISNSVKQEYFSDFDGITKADAKNVFLQSGYICN